MIFSTEQSFQQPQQSEHTWTWPNTNYWLHVVEVTVRSRKQSFPFNKVKVLPLTKNTTILLPLY